MHEGSGGQTDAGNSRVRCLMRGALFEKSLKSSRIKKGAGLSGQKSFKSSSVYHSNSKAAHKRLWSENIFYSNEFRSQFRDVLRDGVPDDVQVDAGIAMDDAVSHTV